MRSINNKSLRSLLAFLCTVIICLTFAGCDVTLSTGGSTTAGSTNTSTTQCQSNCTTGSGVQGVHVYVEPDAGEKLITGAIQSAKKSIWLEMYLMSDKNVLKALEEAANNHIDVRVMLETRALGASSVTTTLDELKAAGAQAKSTNLSFKLTHEKGMIIDGTTAYIMTSNFSRAALGGYSASSGSDNREYDITDTNVQDVQAVTTIFNADWNRTTAQFNDPNLVVSPVNSRSTFMALISSAKHTLFIEAEEMNDSSIERALVSAAGRGVQIEVILPAANTSAGKSNSDGIDVIEKGSVKVREDSKLYMHAKIIVVDGAKAFVGSENISTQSLDKNRELGIIISDTSVLSILQSTFQTDWSVSRSA